MSSDGTTALIGAPGDENPNGDGAGSAYVFEAGGDSWTQQAKLAPDDGHEGDSFGKSVAVSSDGTTALIGAPRDEGPNGGLAGSAYVFEASGGSWTQQAKLAPDDGHEEDTFGYSVAISSDGTTTLIGAYDDEDSNGERGGAAYVFKASGESWTQQTKLASDPGDAVIDEFGFSVALSSDGTTALIGARNGQNSDGEYSGSAYVFEPSGGAWTRQAKLAPNDGEEDDSFGGAVAVSSDGTTTLVGAYGDDNPNGSGAGSAYVFEAGGDSWTQQAKLVPDDGVNGHEFGRSLVMSSNGTTALIGAPGDENPNGEEAGSAYVFEADGGSWTQQAKLAPDGGDENDWFGWGVAVSNYGITALIGAPSDENPNGNDAGSAYVLNL